MAKKDEVKKEENKIELIDNSTDTNFQNENPPNTPPNDLAPYLRFLKAVRTTKPYLTVAPTETPKNFFEQIQFYENGATIRLYVWINGTWRYVALT